MPSSGPRPHLLGIYLSRLRYETNLSPSITSAREAEGEKKEQGKRQNDSMKEAQKLLSVQKRNLGIFWAPATLYSFVAAFHTSLTVFLETLIRRKGLNK